MLAPDPGVVKPLGVPAVIVTLPLAELLAKKFTGYVAEAALKETLVVLTHFPELQSWKLPPVVGLTLSGTETV